MIITFKFDIFFGHKITYFKFYSKTYVVYMNMANNGLTRLTKLNILLSKKSLFPFFEYDYYLSLKI